jgi:hypothetical protein
MWARRAIRFIHKKRNRCCDAAAKFFFTISLVCCCCCCRKHTAHSLWKNTQPPNQRSPPISVEMSLVRWFPTLLDESTLATFFKEKTKRRRRTLKKRKCWKKFFFISHFWTEKKTFWRSVVNLCFDTFFFLFYYFPFFSLKKRKEWLQQWKWQANGRHRERPQEHTWSRVIPRRPISQAKLFFVCVEMDENEQFSSKLTDWLILTRRKRKTIWWRKKNWDVSFREWNEEKREKVFLKNESIKRERFLTLPGNKKNLPKMNHFRLQILDSLNF